jgi:hypothetical protein
VHFDCIINFLTFILSYDSDVRFQDVEDLHTYSSSWEVTAQIISSRMKYTRGGDVIYIAILADLSVRILLKQIILFSVINSRGKKELIDQRSVDESQNSISFHKLLYMVVIFLSSDQSSSKWYILCSKEASSKYIHCINFFVQWPIILKMIYTVLEGG